MVVMTEQLHWWNDPSPMLGIVRSVMLPYALPPSFRSETVVPLFTRM